VATRLGLKKSGGSSPPFRTKTKERQKSRAFLFLLRFLDPILIPLALLLVPAPANAQNPIRVNTRAESGRRSGP
jgi:hypothetical protein